MDHCRGLVWPQKKRRGLVNRPSYEANDERTRNQNLSSLIRFDAYGLNQLPGHQQLPAFLPVPWPCMQPNPSPELFGPSTLDASVRNKNCSQKMQKGSPSQKNRALKKHSAQLIPATKTVMRQRPQSSDRENELAGSSSQSKCMGGSVLPLGAAGGQQASTVPKGKQCNVPDCGKYAVRGGVCIGHGARPRRCNVSGCPRRRVQGGVCVTHGARVKRCSVEGCMKQAKASGVCVGHGAKVKEYRCKVEGCGKYAVRQKVCVAHGALAKNKQISSATTKKSKASRSSTPRGTVSKKREEICASANDRKRSRTQGKEFLAIPTSSESQDYPPEIKTPTANIVDNAFLSLGEAFRTVSPKAGNSGAVRTTRKKTAGSNVKSVKGREQPHFQPLKPRSKTPLFTEENIGSDVSSSEVSQQATSSDLIEASGDLPFVSMEQRKLVCPLSTLSTLATHLITNGKVLGGSLSAVNDPAGPADSRGESYSPRPSVALWDTSLPAGFPGVSHLSNGLGGKKPSVEALRELYREVRGSAADITQNPTRMRLSSILASQ